LRRPKSAVLQRCQQFEQVTEEALRFTLRHLKLELDERACRVLSDAYLRLQPYPEVPDSLRALRDRGLKLAILSNGSPHSIDAVVGNAGLRHCFDHLLSVDPVRVYKPDNRAYELAEQAFGVGHGEILFVSSNACDATGARYFGFPTCWINRGGKTFEEMAQLPDWEVIHLMGAGMSLRPAVRYRLGGAAAHDESRPGVCHQLPSSHGRSMVLVPFPEKYCAGKTGAPDNCCSPDNVHGQGRNKRLSVVRHWLH
jgi:2-haloacid dehalogenase